MNKRINFSITVILLVLMIIPTYAQELTEQHNMDIAVWCLKPGADLLVSSNNKLPENWKPTTNVNKEIIAAGKDTLQSITYRVRQKEGEYDIWARDLSDGSKLIALVNTSNEERNISVRVEDLRVAGTLRDLWTQKDLKEMTWSGGVRVKPNGAALVKVIPFSIYTTAVREDIPGPDYTPEEVCNSFSENLISRRISTNLHYAEVCTALGALWSAEQMNDEEIYQKIRERYSDFYSTKSKFHNYRQHVDISMRGSLPLQIYITSKDDRFLEYGLSYADRQWEDPRPDGLSKESRFWIDDMYMISILQIQAYRASGNVEYASRAAKTLIAYSKKLQRPNGLFYHGEDYPIFWGRGNGWVAVGMAEVLKSLPESHMMYDALFFYYEKMMKALLSFQDNKGMWHQIIDDENSWEETSCTAMFGYAMASGVSSGCLNDKKYKAAISKAWEGLTRYINPDGTVRDVCMGTGQNTDVQYYLDRPRITGDYHGQAPVLWFASELLRINPK